MVVIGKRTSIEDVGEAAREDGELRAKNVVDTPAEYTEKGEDGVESCVGVVYDSGVNLTAIAHTKK